MKIARFRIGRRIAYGAFQGEELAEIRGDIFGRFRITNDRHKLSDVKLLPPTEPQQIWCPGVNFAEYVAFAPCGHDRGEIHPPSHPQPWRKGRNALIGPGDYIVIPKDSPGEVHYEGEVVAVISRVCRRVAPQEASRYILGYCCGNDVSERTWQKEDPTPWRAKGSDSFAPVGPWVETQVDPADLEMIVKLNGREVQRSNTRHMLHSFGAIVSYISQHVTLQPGDLVFSGATGATSPMRSGDVVEVEVTGIGVLSNPVRAEE